MKKQSLLFWVLHALFGVLAATAAEPRMEADSLVDIREVEIVGRRPMKEIGVQKTDFDSVVLKEHIALSIADVLNFNSSIFVKQYGRATLSTASFRGTSPAHTQVLWNGMKINSPMLGITDFSLIPACFIDDASLLHGASSVSSTGGGLGGSVLLATHAPKAEGFTLTFEQGIGSFETFDEYLQLGYGNDRWQLSTRLAYATSPNDYKYRNRDKKENIYDDNHNIIGQYHPTERNRNAAYKDLHLLQEVTVRLNNDDRIGLKAWYLDSDRELPLLTTSYADASRIENRQCEQTLRSLLSWVRTRSTHRLSAQAGYTYSRFTYDHRLRLSDDADAMVSTLEESRNRLHTLFGQATGEWSLGEGWLLTSEVNLHHHRVDARGKEVQSSTGSERLGYDGRRTEWSAAATLRWRASQWFGAGLTLREEGYDDDCSPLIPALVMDGDLLRSSALRWRASLTRNYRYPTLNDCYFQPGGNPDLRPEEGWSYDVGLSFQTNRDRRIVAEGSVAWFDSYIDDWILWYPKPMGYYSPENVKEVHAYGIESDLKLSAKWGRDWSATLQASYAWTASLNEGTPFSSADQSVGKQLPYQPRHTASAALRIGYRSWALHYKWSCYGERFTLSSNGSMIDGRLKAYSVSDLTLEKRITLHRCDLSLKGTIHNLLDEEYTSVLSRPMPGIHYQFFLGITPKWGKK